MRYSYKGGPPQAWVIQDRVSFRSLVPSHVSYHPDQGTLWTFTVRDVPSPLRAKLAVLRLFDCYMQRHLKEVRAWSVGRNRRRRCPSRGP